MSCINAWSNQSNSLSCLLSSQCNEYGTRTNCRCISSGIKDRLLLSGSVGISIVVKDCERCFLRVCVHLISATFTGKKSPWVAFGQFINTIIVLIDELVACCSGREPLFWWCFQFLGGLYPGCFHISKGPKILCS